MESEQMTVAELIAGLQNMPQDAPVCYLYDTFIGQQVTDVWLSKAGYVMVGELHELDSKKYEPVDQAATDKDADR